MKLNQSNSPILFLIFNRPDTTQRVFDVIKRTQPKQLFIAADGPRKKNDTDVLLCERTREIINYIDWDCELHTLFRENNLGCRTAVSSAIDWFFSHVDKGIILEDDCLPDLSFFRFCDELLERYSDDERVMTISGDNFQFYVNKTPYSYYYSRYPHIWGWATWRRAWKHYDMNMNSWPVFRDNKCLYNIFSHKSEVNYWEKNFDMSFNGLINTWDYQWVFSCWIQGALSITPNVNLISNIGFGKQSTHTHNNTIFTELPLQKMEFPLKHPKFFLRDSKSDEFTEKIWFSKKGSLRNSIFCNFISLKEKFLKYCE